jgi:hypothetical protein
VFSNLHITRKIFTISKLQTNLFLQWRLSLKCPFIILKSWPPYKLQLMCKHFFFIPFENSEMACIQSIILSDFSPLYFPSTNDNNNKKEKKMLWDETLSAKICLHHMKFKNLRWNIFEKQTSFNIENHRSPPILKLFIEKALEILKHTF